jgi:putative component of toxin-antitoxin plasmid stabilization module
VTYRDLPDDGIRLLDGGRLAADRDVAARWDVAAGCGVVGSPEVVRSGKVVADRDQVESRVRQAGSGRLGHLSPVGDGISRVSLGNISRVSHGSFVTEQDVVMDAHVAADRDVAADREAAARWCVVARWDIVAELDRGGVGRADRPPFLHRDQVEGSLRRVHLGRVAHWHQAERGAGQIVG